jgi:hypothetical protein
LIFNEEYKAFIRKYVDPRDLGLEYGGLKEIRKI